MLTPEIQHVLETLKTGAQLEKKHRFINMRGQKFTFDAFVRHSLKQLINHVIEPDALPRLLLHFQRYGMMDMPHRQECVHELEAFCEGLLNPPKPKKTPERPDDEMPPAERPLHCVKGVGPAVEKKLNQLGLFTVRDLMRHAPRDYIDYKARQSLNDVMEGDTVTLILTVRRVDAQPVRGGKLTILRFHLADEANNRATTQRFFNQHQRAMLESIKAKHPRGTELLISGKIKWDSYNSCPQIDASEMQILSYEDGDAPDAADAGKSNILPVYPLTQGLNLKVLRRCMANVMAEFGDALEDVLPRPIREAQNLLPLGDALQHLHFPQTLEQADRARHRFGFEELFILQLRLALMRHLYQHTLTGQAIARQAGGLVDEYLGGLPYPLTNAQARAFEEIAADLASPMPMNRLLHGDVGSGKTLVAILTLLLGIENGYQGALMAPTEILAEQHYLGLVESLAPLGIKVGLLVGKLNAKARREVLRDLENEQIKLVIGTHALIQEAVTFHRLGVVVVDEQHRFGVKQRLALREKGAEGHMPELLSMTATPIPRTMAMTLHGDLDVSVLDELPPGRSPIMTELLKNSERETAYTRIEEQLLKGRQAYIVFPLIDESESLSARAATAEFERLRTEVFPHHRLGLLHGKLKPDEKEATMAAFASGETQILVSTTVVEVGVNVPNATVMVIESAERFGLAQLHQLRGRVGRGAHQSYCLLISALKNEETRKRLAILEETGNGFVIAEHDLALRGPGEYVGARQSGLPELRFASLVDDYTLLTQAREAAFSLLQAHGPEALEAAYPALWQRLQLNASDELQWLSSG